MSGRRKSDAVTSATIDENLSLRTSETIATKLLSPGEEKESVDKKVSETRTLNQRGILTTDKLASLSRDELEARWREQETMLSTMTERAEKLQKEVLELSKVRENQERLRGQVAEHQRKEQYLTMRLATKEQEIQDLGTQMQELKATSGNSSCKTSLVDPAINLLIERLKRDLDASRTKMEETQNELSAWKFTPDSNTGKQLMAKCRLLIKENEDLGRMISSGRLAKLEGDLALQRTFAENLKKSQSEMDEFLQEMDEDTEGMQGTVCYLQQQLREAKEQLSAARLQLAQQSTNQPEVGGETGSVKETGNGGNERTLHESRPIKMEDDSAERTITPTNGEGVKGGEGRERTMGEGDTESPSEAPHINGQQKRTRSSPLPDEEGGDGEAAFKKNRHDDETTPFENGLATAE